MSDKSVREQTPAARRFGQHVRLCRRARGQTQEELAEASGLSADTIRRLEHGSFSPSLQTLRKLCKGMQLQLSTLFDSFELGERDRTREIVDAIACLTVEQQDVLLQIIRALSGLLRGTSRENEA